MNDEEEVLRKWTDAELSEAFAKQPDGSKRWMYCVMSSMKSRKDRRRVCNVGKWCFTKEEAWASANPNTASVSEAM